MKGPFKRTAEGRGRVTSKENVQVIRTNSIDGSPLLMHKAQSLHEHINEADTNLHILPVLTSKSLMTGGLFVC